MLNSSNTVIDSSPSNVVQIIFSNKGILSVDIAKIIDQIKITINNSSFNSLTYINLGTNFIGDKGAKIIANTFLTANYNIINLCLTNNNIEDKGTIKIAKALKENTSLKVLYLNFNYIKNAGAVALSNALKINKSLTFLDVSSNKIQQEGAIAFFQALQLNKIINSFSIRDNRIGDNGLIELANLINQTKTIIQLQFTFLYTTEIAKTAIINALAANTLILHVYCGTLDQKIFEGLNLRNHQEFEQKINQISNNKELTLPAYNALLYQLRFFINCKWVLGYEFDKLKNINIEEVNKTAHDKLSSRIFWIKRVCQTKMPFSIPDKNIVLPPEICYKIFSYLDLENISTVSNKSNNCESNNIFK